MCLVSLIPLQDGCILSSNRDEYLDRDAKEVVSELINDQKIWYPKDTAGGSWIILAENNRAICLLNGAKDNHKRVLPYRLSRGVMMKEFFTYDHSVSFFEHFDFWNIEPFTMIIVEGMDHRYEFRWDGNTKHIRELSPNDIHIWSSSTLYDKESQVRREMMLRSSLKDTSEDHSSIKQAHLVKDENDLSKGLYVKLGDIVETISHTQVIIQKNKSQLIYHNLLSDKIIHKTSI